MSLILSAPIPEIPVADLVAAIEYYREKLGFHLDWTETGIGLAGVSRDGCRLFLANQDYRSKGNDPPIVIWINLNSKAEVDELHSDWATRGASIRSVPESKPWGLHEFTAADDDGNLFRVFYDFATPERELGSKD